MSARFPVITGQGVIAAPGTTVEEIWRAVASGACGLRPLSLFTSPRYGQIPVGEIPFDLQALGAPQRGSRSDKLAWLAVRDAVRAAGLDLGRAGDRTGVVLGCSVGGSYDSEKFLVTLLKKGRMRPCATRFHECSAPVDLVANSFGCYGPSFAISTACSSGGLAIATAADLIQSGAADVVITGGTDSLSRTTWAGFHSLLLVDAEGCRPFDVERGGMSFGEGAAALVLESEAHARERGATILARLTGWGASCDAYHATAPHPDGQGAVAAMQAALRRANLRPHDIHYINAHGTGTRDNDLTEARAMQAVFGTRVPPFSSTKRVFGHALAASGALEAVVCIEALRHQQQPGNPGFRQRDSAIGLSPVERTRAARLTHVMSNSFGFGGNNAAVVFSRADVAPQTRATPVKPAAVISVGALLPEQVVERHTQWPLPTVTVTAHACGPFSDLATLNPIQRRRLNRLSQMAILAARRAGRPDPAQRVAITLGTGFGSLDEGAIFLENLIAKNEAEPMPTRFPGSVHNAPAGQVAIDLAAHGLNSAPTADEISFESALWQAMNQLACNEADEAFAGALDELNKYPLYLGKRWGVWNAESRPGEAAVFARLTPAAETPLARVNTIRLGRFRQPFDAEAEAQWIASSVDLAAVTLLITGAQGWRKFDSRYLDVVAALNRRRAQPLEHQTYKPDCGEFPAASGVGFVRAVTAARERGIRVLLYTLAWRGGKAICLVEP